MRLFVCDLHSFTEVTISSLLSVTYYKPKATNKNKTAAFLTALFGKVSKS